LPPRRVPTGLWLRSGSRRPGSRRYSRLAVREKTVPQCAKRRLADHHPCSSERAQALATALQQEFGVPFTLFDATDGTMVCFDPTDPHAPEERRHAVDPETVLALAQAGQACLTALPDDRYRLALIAPVRG